MGASFTARRTGETGERGGRFGVRTLGEDILSRLGLSPQQSILDAFVQFSLCIGTFRVYLRKNGCRDPLEFLEEEPLFGRLGGNRSSTLVIIDTSAAYRGLPIYTGLEVLLVIFLGRLGLAGRFHVPKKYISSNSLWNTYRV